MDSNVVFLINYPPVIILIVPRRYVFFCYRLSRTQFFIASGAIKPKIAFFSKNPFLIAPEAMKTSNGQK